MTARRALLAAFRRLGDLGLCPGTSGNASVRTPGGFLVTPTGMAADDMREVDMVAVDPGGRARGRRTPSSEWRLHRDLYAARPAACAIVHTHSPFATALACLRRGIPAFHYMVGVAGGAIRCARYATYGTEDLSRRASEALRGRKACLLANHGAVAVGASLAEAVKIAVEVEALAKSYLAALAVGSPVILDESEMERVLAKLATYGQPVIRSAARSSGPPASPAVRAGKTRAARSRPSRR